MPDRLDPWRAVQAGSAFAGEVPLERLPRLASVVPGARGPARYELGFGRDAQGRAVALGRVSMTLLLTCQRCLGELAVPVDAPIALALVRDATGADALGLAEIEIEGLPEGLEPVPLGRDPIGPLELLEDELLLAIPQIPLHPDRDCRGVGQPEPAEPKAERRESPFAVLAALRGQGAKADER